MNFTLISISLTVKKSIGLNGFDMIFFTAYRFSNTEVLQAKRYFLYR